MESTLVCRACLCTISLEYIDLETIIYENKTFLDYFKFCTKLQVALDDDLPNNICVSCGKSLQIAYEFIKSSVESDQVLRNCLSTFGDYRCLEESKQQVAVLIKKEEEYLENEALEFQTVSEEDYNSCEIKKEEDFEALPEFEVVLSNEDTATDQGNDDSSWPDMTVEIDDEKDEDVNKKCTTCGVIISEDEYDGHMNMHRGRKPYSCDLCNEKFFCRKKMETHKKSKHKDNQQQENYICGWCGAAFDCRSKLCQHRLIDHHGKVPSSCLTCGEEFPNEPSLRMHVKKSHSVPKKPVLCPYCNKEFKGIALHIKCNHPDILRIPMPEEGSTQLSRNQCPHCFRYCQSRNMLNDHLNTHTGNRPYSCSICGKSFHKKTICDRHERVVHQSKDAPKEKCEYCDFTTSNIHSLKSHLHRHKKPAEKKYLCSFCPMKFMNPKTLYIHEDFKHRNAEKAYECDICQKKFSIKRKLNEHKLCVHVEGRPFQCSECEKTFKNDFQLKAHQKLHTEREIDCPQCDKKFARQVDLKIHMRTHTGELPYECHLCDKRYAIKVRLTYHMQKHMGIKHKCQHCPSEFNSRSRLRLHMFKHIGMPYTCDSCQMGFPNRAGLSRHAKTAHNIVLSVADLLENRRKNEKNMLRSVDCTSHQIQTNASANDEEF